MIPIKDASKLKKDQVVYAFDGEDKWVGCKVLEVRKDRFTVLLEEVGGDAPGTRWTEEWHNLLDEEYFKTIE
jgi:hypothetical protein